MEIGKLAIGIIALFLVISAVQLFQINSLKKDFSSNALTGNAVSNAQNSNANNAVDTSGWTANEKMNYEMHGVIPARAQNTVKQTTKAPTMVGGC